MAVVRMKERIDMALAGIGETHARTRVTSRDVEGIIDEPAARGGTNAGLTPTETLMASLIGCTNVITHRLAEREGVQIHDLRIACRAKFDRRGAALEAEIERPFDDIVLDISARTNAPPDRLARIREDLGRFCPVSKVIRGSGASIVENWTFEPL